MAMDVSIMIEGQDGLSWPRWQRLARAAEDLGFAGLYRSDHFTNPGEGFKDALEAWVAFAWLASNTQRISFGPLVSPLTFRNPVILAWQASGIDALASGRLRIGLGAGWQEREHAAFGFRLPPLDERFARFEEGIQIVTALTRATEPVTWAGDYFQLDDALLQPRSPRADGPPIVIGGNGPKRTLPLAARYGDEWNAVFLTLDQFRERGTRLDELLAAEGRTPESLKRTLMTRGMIAHDEAGLLAKSSTEQLTQLRERGAVIGTPNEIVDQLGRLREGGVQGVMLQWADLDDLSGLELIASHVLPRM